MRKVTLDLIVNDCDKFAVCTDSEGFGGNDVEINFYSDLASAVNFAMGAYWAKVIDFTTGEVVRTIGSGPRANTIQPTGGRLT